MKFRFIPRNIVNDVFDEDHIRQLLRDKDYEVIEEVVVVELPEVEAMEETLEFENEETDEDEVTTPKRGRPRKRVYNNEY